MFGKSDLRRLLCCVFDRRGCRDGASSSPRRSPLDETAQKKVDLSECASSEGYEILRNLLTTTFDNIEARYEHDGEVTGVPTGFSLLDEMTSGMQPSELIIVAARPAVGGTAFCLNLAQNAALRGGGDAPYPVLFFSLEMSKEAIVERLLASEARVESSKVRRGYLSSHDWDELSRAASRLAMAPLWIDDAVAPTILELRAKVRRFRNDRAIFTHSRKKGLIIIDNLQLVRSHERTRNCEQDRIEINRSLKALAKEVELPIVVLSKLRRATEADGRNFGRPQFNFGRPQLSDLQESGVFERDADVILLLHRGHDAQWSSDLKRETELILGKNRRGPVGVIRLMFHGAYLRFELSAELEE